jgi:glycosyltransferase involved in cell wall biosynthesis
VQSSEILSINGVTCLIPNKNGVDFFPYLEDYFQSVTYANLEILIIDDGSEDSSFETATAWASRDSRVTLWRNIGSGLVDALNFGIEKSRYDWIARFDVDDRYEVDRLTKQLEVINSGAVLVFSDFKFLLNEKYRSKTMPGPVSHLPTIVSFYSNRRTPHSSALFLKSAAIEAGLYKQSEYLAEDLGLWLRISKIGKIESVPLTLIDYRVSQQSLLSQNRKASVKVRNAIRDKEGFVGHARLATQKLRKTQDLYKNLPFSHMRYVLHVIDLLEIFVRERRLKFTLALLIRVLPTLGYKHYGSIIYILYLRRKKNTSH